MPSSGSVRGILAPPASPAAPCGVRRCTQHYRKARVCRPRIVRSGVAKRPSLGDHWRIRTSAAIRALGGPDEPSQSCSLGDRERDRVPGDAAGRRAGSGPERGRHGNVDPTSHAGRPAGPAGLLDHADLHTARASRPPGRSGVLHRRGVDPAPGAADSRRRRPAGPQRHHHRRPGRAGPRPRPDPPRRNLRPLRQRHLARHPGAEGTVHTPDLTRHRSA